MNNSKNPKQRGSILGLLAMFGATAIAGLPKFAVGIRTGNHAAPPHIQAQIVTAAKAKRERRAASRRMQIALAQGRPWGVLDS